MKTTNNNPKFFFVTYYSNGVKSKELFMGETPQEALQAAKAARPSYKGFKVGKTAYNTLGEKY